MTRRPDETTEQYHARLASEAAASGDLVLVPRVPTTAMTIAFHEASPHRPTGWTAEDAWNAMLAASPFAEMGDR